jgi:hypothetical protein
MALSVEFRPPVGPPCGLTILSRSSSDFLKPQMSPRILLKAIAITDSITAHTVLCDEQKYVHERKELIVLRATIICVPAPLLSDGVAIKASLSI